MRNKNTREVPWFRFGVRRSEAKPIFSLGSIFRLGIYFAWFNTSLSSIVRLVPFFARFNFSLGSYFRGFNFRGFSNPRKFKHSEVFDVYSSTGKFFYRTMYQCSHPTTRAHYTVPFMCIASQVCRYDFDIAYQIWICLKNDFFFWNLAVYMFVENLPLAQ